MRTPRRHHALFGGSRALLLVLLAVLLTLLLAHAPAQACAGGGCVGAGPRLASVSSGRAGLMNGLYGALLGNGSALNLSVADWNAIATGDVSVLKTVNALQATLGVSSPSSALNTNATLAQVIGAMATAATGDGTNASAALGNLSQAVALAPGTVRLGDLLVTDSGIGTTRINALELASGTVQLYNSKNVLTTAPQPIGLSGSALGLSGLLNSLTLQAQVVEPPVFICGPVGSTFHTATIRLKLHVDLVSIPLNVSALLALGVGASVSIAQLDLNVEVARADGAIAQIDAVLGTLRVQVTPGVAALYLGIIPDNLFFNRSRAVTAADVTPANVATASITSLGNTTNLTIKAQGSATGAAPSQSVLNFTGPYPQTLTAYTQAGFTSSLVNSLLANLTITYTPSLGGLLDGLLGNTLKAIVRSGLLAPVGNVLGSVVDPLLETLGVRLGEVDVQVSGVYLSCSVSGTVYNDTNHSAAFDAGEPGTGLTLYAKLIAAGTPASAAQTVAVDPATGAYSFASVATGSYTVVVCATNTQSDVTPAVPAGWLATEQPTFSRSLALATDAINQRFGLYHGSKLSGTVFRDTGSGGGTANNAIKDGTEAGITGATVSATDATGATLIDRTRSGDAGSYTLWLPHTAVGSVKIVQTGSAEFVPVGGAVGTTSGSYALAADTTTFTLASGAAYSGVHFAKVPATRFDTDGQQTTQPGTVVFYAHNFTAGTAGQLTFLTAAPTTLSFSALVYEDINCNGQLDSGDALITAARSVVAGQKLCVVVKVAVPTNAPAGSQYPLAITARLAYANHTLVGDHVRDDLTTVGDGSDGLQLVKTVDRSAAASGDVITYTIAYRNLSTQGMTTLKILDATPAYTVHQSALCGTTPGGGLACTVGTQPAAGAAGSVEWVFTGTLAAGASGTVILRVVLQ